MKTKQLFGIIVLTLMVALVASACSPASQPVVTAQVADDEHADDEPADTHAPEDHMAGMHDDVPEAAALRPNPFEADEESVAKGSALYAANCAICHGETGEGDGPAAPGLEIIPADLHEDHVQVLTDGAFFYIISHGKPETPMPAWEDLLSEDERWHVINFLRTFLVSG